MKKILILLLVIPLLSFSQERKTKEDKKVNYAFIPILMYNSSFGAQYGAMASSYFKLNSKDSISPASNIGFMGSYFQNDSYFSVLFSKMYYKEDNYRTKVGLGVANINFQTYLNINDIPPELYQNYDIDDDEVVVDYNTFSIFAYLEGTKKVYDNLFLGLRFVFSNKKTEFDTDNKPVEEVNLFGFGLASEYDDRDNVFNPNKGQNAKFNTFSFLEGFGSSDQYHKIEMQYNKYFSLSSKSVILLRAFGIISVGDVPFSGKNIVSRDDMRGYTNGKYRANQVYDIQTELRWNFYKKWGLVAFGGVAVATDDFSGTEYSGLLGSIGTGIRFKAIKSRNINIGVDVAKGKDDWGIYFRIGETFTK